MKMVWNAVLKEKKMILAIDDSSFIQRVIEKTLFVIKEEIDYKIVSSGEEAIDFLTKSERLPDLFLCDMIMPGMSGIEFKQKTSVNPDWVKIPFIFLSGEENLLEFDSRVLDYIQKPFEEDDFIQRLKNCL